MATDTDSSIGSKPFKLVYDYIDEDIPIIMRLTKNKQGVEAKGEIAIFRS